MSEFTEILLVSPLADGETWVIRERFSYHVGAEESKEVINVPIGFQTDFASVPWLLTLIVPRWGKYGKAAVVHDFVYSQEDSSLPYDRRRADRIFLEGMAVLGVARWRRTLMYWAVRAFGWRAWNRALRRIAEDVSRIRPVPEKANAQRQW